MPSNWPHFMWGGSDAHGNNCVLRITADGTVSYVCDATPNDPHKTWELLRQLNDPLARQCLKLTRPDLHNLDD